MTVLRAFLAHSNEDSPLVLEIYYLLKLDGFLPWVDKQDLVPGHDWEFEIEKAVRASHAVIAFISSSGINRSGYLHKEIALAIDVAERQPEGAIYIIPIRLDECEMPKRLSHLHWSSIPRDMVAEIYVTLQSSLLERASELGFLTPEQIKNIPRMPAMEKGAGTTLLRGGRYLVRGQNPNGSKYFGIAQVKDSTGKYQISWNIDGREIAEYEVAFSSQSGFGIYDGTWGKGGTEQLIPASPTFIDATVPAV